MSCKESLVGPDCPVNSVSLGDRGDVAQPRVLFDKCAIIVYEHLLEIIFVCNGFVDNGVVENASRFVES